MTSKRTLGSYRPRLVSSPEVIHDVAATCCYPLCIGEVHWRVGIAKIGLDGTLYDQILDWVFALGLTPPRFSNLSGYDLYFAMARGAEGAVALDMSKYFDTNYHYMVGVSLSMHLQYCVKRLQAATLVCSNRTSVLVQ